jgi:hypothetical protein
MLPLTRSRDRARFFKGLSAVWTPLQLFADNEVGAWYDPSDLTTLYEDAAGTVPVTAVEKPVGLMLDKSKGLVLGVERSGGLATGTLNLAAFATDTGETLPADVKVLKFVVSVSAFTSGSLTIGVGAQSVTANRALTISSAGTFSAIYMIPASETVIQYRTLGSGFVGTIDNISVRELPGNHAYTPGATSVQTTNSPRLSARYNLLQYTEDFSNAAWVLAGSVLGSVVPPTRTSYTGTLPNGTTGTIYRFSFPAVTAANSFSIAYQISNLAQQASVNYKPSLYIKRVSGGTKLPLLVESSTTGPTSGGYTSSVLDVTDSWVQYSYLSALTGTPAGNIVPTFGFDGRIPSNLNLGAITVDVWGADFRVANDGAGLPLYQRVGNGAVGSADYDQTGFPQGESFDGTDDYHIAAVSGGATTAFFFCASIRLGRVGSVQTIFSDAGTNTGYRVRINASNQLEFSAGNGSAYTTATTTAALGLAERAVITCWHDGTNLNAQINNGTVAQAAFATATAGTAQITMGRDNNLTTSPFRGYVYETVYVKNDVQTAGQIASAKTYCATAGKITL